MNVKKRGLMKFVKISDTAQINPNRIGAIETLVTTKGKRLIVYVDGRSFECTVPYEEIMPKLTALDETKQFFAG
jgi:hypothetical protein